MKYPGMHNLYWFSIILGLIHRTLQKIAYLLIRVGDWMNIVWKGLRRLSVWLMVSERNNKLDEIGDKLYYTLKTETEDKDIVTPT